jgi:hypothetical protein
VKEILTSLSPRSTSHLALQTANWQSGTRVKVRLEGSHLNVPAPEQEFTWEGNYSVVDFDVTVPPDAPEYVTVVKFDVLIDEIIIARLRLDLSIGPTSGEIGTATVEPARTAFASYASADRQRVLDRVAAVSISAGLDIFLDCLSLHPSEEWKLRLAAEIKKRELFLLFWSSQAKKSPWVSWEWHTALEEKGLSGMQIQPLQTVREAPPPEELKELHFGDPYMLARRAYDSLSSEDKKNRPTLDA